MLTSPKVTEIRKDREIKGEKAGEAREVINDLEFAGVLSSLLSVLPRRRRRRWMRIFLEAT